MLVVEQLGGGACSFVVRAAPGHPLVPFFFVAAVGGALSFLVMLDGMAPVYAATLFAALVGAWRLSRRFVVREESLTAIEGIGLQLCTRCASGRETAQFIEVAAISAIFVAEAVRTDRCYFYLACLLHGADGADGASAATTPRMVVPFRHLLPPLHELQQVNHGVWSTLYGTEPTAAAG